MTSYDIGDGVTLRHAIYKGDGSLTAATVTLKVTDPVDVTTTVNNSSPSTGIYVSEEIIADRPGVWSFTWTSAGTVNDVTNGTFAVASDTTSGWATLSDVFDITGISATVPQLKQAQAVITVHVGRTPDADAAVNNRDLYWLKQAVCWQAAWQAGQPGYENRSSVKSVDQDAARWDYTSESAVVLAPLAIRAIRNLSWMGNRVLSLADVAAPVPAAFNVETSDGSHLWEPL